MGLCRRDLSDGADLALAASFPLTQTIFRGVGRNKISFAISVVIVIIATATLYHLLRGIDVDKVIAALKAQSALRILIAGALVIAGDANLIRNDLFPLHTIGKRKVPLRVNSLRELHEIYDRPLARRPTLTCPGAVSRRPVLGPQRRRCRQDWIRNRNDVLAGQYICARWRRNLCARRAVHRRSPIPMDQPPIGLSGMVALACYLIWLVARPRIVGRADWRIALPNLRAPSCTSASALSIAAWRHCRSSCCCRTAPPSALRRSSSSSFSPRRRVRQSHTRQPRRRRAARLIGLPQISARIFSDALTFWVLIFSFRHSRHIDIRVTRIAFAGAGAWPASPIGR